MVLRHCVWSTILPSTGSGGIEPETLIYRIWNIDISEPDMSYSLETQQARSTAPANIYLTFLQRPRIIIGIIKGNVSAANILKQVLGTTSDFGIDQILLALGPTSPLSLDASVAKILWTTFLDEADMQDENDPTVVLPTNLTDLSVKFEKLSKIGPVRLLLGDFLDSILSVSTESTVFVFLSKFLTRIRENKQTAFFLVTEDMHDAKKTAMVKRFADIVIEYQRVQDDSNRKVETSILDYAQDNYTYRQRNGSSDTDPERQPLLAQWNKEIAFQP